MTIGNSMKKISLTDCLIRQFEPKCLMFKTVSLDFSGFQGCQNAKIVDNTITPSELIAHCPPSFRHIHRHKAASRDRQLMAVNCLSSSVIVTVCFRDYSL